MKMLFATFLLTFFLSASGYSQTACFDLFKTDELKSLDTEFVSFVHMEPDQFGFNHFFYIEKEDANYFLNRNRSDPHGDGDVIPNLFGKEVSRFWGFERVGFSWKGDIFASPTAESLNFRIEVFNKSSDQYLKVPFRFLEVDQSVISEKKHVELHSKKLFPIASQGWVRMHDINYHTMSVLLIPRQYHEAAFLISEILFKFDKFVQARKEVRDNERSYSNSIMRLRSRDIDVTGNLILDMRDHLLHARDLEVLLKDRNVLFRYARPGESALGYLRSLIQGIDVNNNLRASKKLMEQSLQEFLEQLSREDLDRFSQVIIPFYTLESLAGSIKKHFQRFHRQTMDIQKELDKKDHN